MKNDGRDEKGNRFVYKTGGFYFVDKIRGRGRA
jgi:hypothetical protein